MRTSTEAHMAHLDATPLERTAVMLTMDAMRGQCTNTAQDRSATPGISRCQMATKGQER